MKLVEINQNDWKKLWETTDKKFQERSLKKMPVMKMNFDQLNFFFSSYNVWKHVRYPTLIGRQPGVKVEEPTPFGKEI